MHDASFLGVYSLRVDAPKGHMPKKLYFVWAESSGTFLIQMLNGAYQPVGEKKSIGPATFKLKYTHEATDLAVPVSTEKPWITGGTLQKAEKATKVALAPQGPSRTAPKVPAKISPPARPEQVTEQYLRDVFAKSIKRCHSVHDKKAAIAALQNIIEVEEGIVAEHKFMFTDFGIALRKSNLLELSLNCCKRVLELAPDDDHAYFNAARILSEMGEFADAEQHVLKAQLMNPHEGVYQLLLDYIQVERRRRWRPQKQAVENRKNQTKRQRVYR